MSYVWTSKILDLPSVASHYRLLLPEFFAKILRIIEFRVFQMKVAERPSRHQTSLAESEAYLDITSFGVILFADDNVVIGEFSAEPVLLLLLASVQLRVQLDR